jgi:hypothetical protein
MGKYTAAVRDHLVVPVRVGLTREEEQVNRWRGWPVPASSLLQLVIDTGSGRTTLVPGVIAHLNPATHGTARVETSHAAGEVKLFWVRLEFPGTSLAAIPEIAVVRLAMPRSLLAYQGVIGRDVLRRWEYFRFEGRRGRFTIRDTPGGLFGWLTG